VTSEKTDAERAAVATRKAIRKMQKARRRKSRPRIVGEIGHRDSMMFDHEFDDTDPVVYDRRGKKWQQHRWLER
jgi:hypothetical protein